MSELRQQLDFAIAAAHEAGRITLGHFQSELLASEAKEDLSPVTVADRDAEQRIRERIEQAYPTHAVLGEEFGESAEGASHRWLIDPIDGTRSFVRGVPLYGVLIALEVDGEVTLGVAHFPALTETVWAARGQGCYWNGRRCSVRSGSSLAEAFVGFTNAGSFDRYGREEAWRRVRAASAYTAGWSDAYGHALVASGRLELMLDPAMNVWDCGPFPVILAEAGGYFGDWSGRSTIYGGEALSTTWDLLPQVLELLGEDGSLGDVSDGSP